MPTLYHRVESTGVSILHPVAEQVVTGLLDELDLTVLFQDSVYVLNSLTAYSQYADPSGTPTVVKDRCDVHVNFVMDQAQVPWPTMSPHTTTAYGLRSTHKGSHGSIFYDEKAGILIEQRTVPCAFEMEFNMSFQTFDDASRTFDMIKSRYTGSLVQAPFDIAFSYPVTMEMYKYLFAVYDAKTDYANKEFMDYINDMKVAQISFDVRRSQLANEDADKSLMIRCQQLNCMAQLTMDQKEPEAHHVDQLPDAFSLTFSLVFQFGRPNILAVHTPVSVDNTLLPPAFFTSGMYTRHHNNNVAGTFQDLMIGEFAQRTYGVPNNAIQTVRMPDYDDWFTADRQYQYHEYRPFLIAHFTLDGPVTTIDLKELGDIALHPIVQAIMQDTGSGVLDYGGIFHVGVYANELRLGRELVTIDENLILTITSSRPDRVYHLVISETTAINKTKPEWDPILIRYRFFFPMTIERNLDYLIKKSYFYIDYNEAFLTLIGRLWATGKIKALLRNMVLLGEDTNELFSYTQNISQLADYLAYKQSMRDDYTLPLTDPQDPESPPVAIVKDYYDTIASVEGRSLLVAFIEQCLLAGEITLEEVPAQYLRPSASVYPYSSSAGGYYGFNSPIRVFRYNIRTQ